MSDIIIAAAAAKTVKLKTEGKNTFEKKLTNYMMAVEEVPPPTKHDEAERLVRRLVGLTQKGEWDMAIENLKVT